MSPVKTTLRAERRLAYIRGWEGARENTPQTAVPDRFAGVEEFEHAWRCGWEDGYNLPLSQACNPYEAGFDYE